MDFTRNIFIVIGILVIFGYGEISAKERRDVVGCEPHWHHFHKACFHVNKSKETFDQAEKSCRAVGGSLASIHSSRELDFVENITFSHLTSVWVGQHMVNFTVRWTDNTTLDFQPDGLTYLTAEKGCMVLNEDPKGFARMDATNCSQYLPFVCKKSADSKCKDEDIDWLNVKGRSFPKHNIKKIDDVENMGKCKRICLRQSEFSCLSVNYLRAKKYCILSSDTMKSSGIDLIRSRQFTYAEWSCGDQKDKAKALATLRLGNIRASDQEQDSDDEPPAATEPAQQKPKDAVCPQHYQFMAGVCIRASFKAMTYWDAKQHCEKEGGRMSNILRMQGIPDIGGVYRDLDRKLRKASLTEHAFWLGATWSKSTQLVWADPDEVQSPNWSRGNPSSKYECVIVTEKEKWETRPCDSRFSFICKKDATTTREDVEYFTLKGLFTQLANLTNAQMPACPRDFPQKRHHRFILPPTNGYLQNYRSRTVMCKNIYSEYRENSVFIASIRARLWKHRNDSDPIPIIVGPSMKGRSRYRRQAQAWRLLKPDVYYRQTGIPLPCHHLINKTIIHGLGWRNTNTMQYSWSETFTSKTFTQLRCMDEKLLRKIFLSARDLTIGELKSLPSTVYRLFSPEFYRQLDMEHRWAYCAGLLMSKPTSHDVKYAIEDKDCRDIMTYSNMSRLLPVSVTANEYIMSLFCDYTWKERNGASCRLHDIEAYEFCFKIGGIRYYDLRPKCMSKQFTAILMERIKSAISAKGQHDRLQVYAGQILLVHDFVTSSSLFCLLLDNIDDIRVRRRLLQLPMAKDWILECEVPSNLRGSCSQSFNGFDDPRVQRVAIKGLAKVKKPLSYRTTRVILALCARADCPDDVLDLLDPATAFQNMDACRPAGCWTDPTVGAKVAGILRLVRSYIRHRPLTVHDLLKLKCVLPGLGRHFLFKQKREQVVTFAIMALQHTPLDRRTANQLARVVISREQHRLMTKKPSPNALNQIYDYFKPLGRLLPYVDPDLVDEMDPDVCSKFLPDLAQCTDKCDAIRPEWFLAWKERAMAGRGWSLHECHEIIQSCNGGKFLSPGDIYECAKAFPSSIFHIENKKFLNRHMCYAVLNVQSQRWKEPLEKWSAKAIRQELGRLIIGLHPENITRILERAIESDQTPKPKQTKSVDDDDYAEDEYRGKKDMRRLRIGRVRGKRNVEDEDESVETKDENETALDYILLFASYFPQLRSTQRYAVMDALNDLAFFLPSDLDENSFRMIRKIVLNDNTGSLIRSILMASRDKQETIKKICRGIKIPYIDKEFLADIISLYKKAVGTTMLDRDDVLALDQCAFGLNINDLRSLTDRGILEMCSSGVHYYDWDDDTMSLLAKRTLDALHVDDLTDMKMEAFRNCSSVITLIPGDDVRLIRNLKLRCQAFSVLKHAYWLRRTTLSTRIERGEIKLDVSPGSAMYWYKKWEPIRKMWDGHIEQGWAASTNACSRVKEEARRMKRMKRRHRRRKRYRRDVFDLNQEKGYTMFQPRTCDDLRKLGDAVVEQGKQIFTSLKKHDFSDCLDFLGSREGYSKESIDHLAMLAKKHGGETSSWHPQFTLELGCISQGLSEDDLHRLPLNDSLVIESLGSFGGWSPTQLKAIHLAYLQASGKKYSTLTGGDLTRMKNLVCGISPDNILLISPKVYRQAAGTIGEASSCTLDQQRALAHLAKKSFGTDVTKWQQDTIGRVGSVISGLSEEDIRSLDRQQIDAISPRVIRILPPEIFHAFSVDQLKCFDGDQARQISGEQLQALSREKRKTVVSLSSRRKANIYSGNDDEMMNEMEPLISNLD
ncbi:uncharacterized protein LOC135485362 isoform X2 [Lineus longissimus]|uniref:uncharacterized protein LOC135485362 isoform X2 n=1 Tax=Lineus longissimus TaxID=88925 RepID=UPI002B4C308D